VSTLQELLGKKMSGIDGGHLPEFYLLKDGKDTNFAPSKLEENSREIGMD
jgi:hypothetical protein